MFLVGGYFNLLISLALDTLLISSSTWLSKSALCLISKLAVFQNTAKNLAKKFESYIALHERLPILIGRLGITIKLYGKMIIDFLMILYLFFLLKYVTKGKFTIALLFLLFFNVLFFVFIFDNSSWDVIKSSYGMAPFALSSIINAQVILVFFLRNKGAYKIGLSSFIPPILFSFWDFNFIFPAHPLMTLYQYDIFYKFLPRFHINLINVIILYTIPFCFLLPLKRIILILLIACLSFFTNWNLSEHKKLGIKVLIVQTGMYASTHGRMADLRDEVFKYRDADIVIFSESPIVGFKDGSRTAFSREFLDEIKRKRDGKLYILNSYGFIDDERHNNNLSLYVLDGKTFVKYKSKLVPFWETPGLFYRDVDWESPYFSIPSTNNNDKYKFRNIYINSYICYEAMFVNHFNKLSDLTIIQSNYESFSKGYDSVVKNGNVLAYVNKSYSFKNFISVQNMGGTIFVDSSGRFHWDVYKKSKEKSVFLLEI
ncbi:hypothetical protein ACFKBN_004930 [Escherichia coli]